MRATSDTLDPVLAHRQQAEYFGALSHELRTPLNGLLGYANLLLEGHYGALNDPQSKAVHEMEEAARHLLGVIESLLEFSRVSQGKRAPRSHRVPLAELTDGILRRVAPLAAAKRITVTSNIGVSSVESDEYLLEQLLTNLLGNAIKFTPKGGQIGVICRAFGDDAVELGVTDTGPGIPPESRQRVFEPFVQLDSGHTRAHGGTGLGLSLSQWYACALQGAIGIEDHSPQGSYLVTLLPAKLCLAEGFVSSDVFDAQIAIARRTAQRIPDRFALLEIAGAPADEDTAMFLRSVLHASDLITVYEGAIRIAMFGADGLAARMWGERLKNLFLYERRLPVGVKLRKLEEEP